MWAEWTNLVAKYPDDDGVMAASDCAWDYVVSLK